MKGLLEKSACGLIKKKKKSITVTVKDLLVTLLVVKSLQEFFHFPFGLQQ